MVASDGLGVRRYIRRKKYVGGRLWGPGDRRVRPPLLGVPLSPGPLERPPTYFFLLYIPMYPENIRGDDEKLFPPP